MTKTLVDGKFTLGWKRNPSFRGPLRRIERGRGMKSPRQKDISSPVKFQPISLVIQNIDDSVKKSWRHELEILLETKIKSWQEILKAIRQPIRYFQARNTRVSHRPKFQGNRFLQPEAANPGIPSPRCREHVLPFHDSRTCEWSPSLESRGIEKPAGISVHFIRGAGNSRQKCKQPFQNMFPEYSRASKFFSVGTEEGKLIKTFVSKGSKNVMMRNVSSVGIYLLQDERVKFKRKCNLAY